MSKEGIQIGLSREAWGPRFWKILHTMAERVGQQTSLIQMNDEADAWSILIRAQAFVMPCTLCKQHFLEFQTLKPLGNLRSLHGEARKLWIRTWIWECHKRVNDQNEKITPPLEDLPTLYPKQSIQKELVELLGMFQLAHTKQQLKPEDTNRWKVQVARLRILYGI
jgi:hypothetical protein